jgi:hypothetical protein
VASCTQNVSHKLIVWCGRSSLRATLDLYWGVTILILNFLYLSLVRGMLSIFDCTANVDGLRFLDEDPAILCDEVQITIMSVPTGIRTLTCLPPSCRRSSPLSVSTSRCTWWTAWWSSVANEALGVHVDGSVLYGTTCTLLMDPFHSS